MDDVIFGAQTKKIFEGQIVSAALDKVGIRERVDDLEQEVLARQQEPLARQQEALARKQMAATDRLRRDVDRLLDEAIRNGKAQQL